MAFPGLDCLRRGLTVLNGAALRQFGIDSYDGSVDISTYRGDSGKALSLSGVNRILDATRRLSVVAQRTDARSIWERLVLTKSIGHYLSLVSKAHAEYLAGRLRRDKVAGAVIDFHGNTSRTSAEAIRTIQRSTMRRVNSLPMKVWTNLNHLPATINKSWKDLSDRSYLRVIFRPLALYCEIDTQCRTRTYDTLVALIGKDAQLVRACLYVDPDATIALAKAPNAREMLREELCWWFVHAEGRTEQERVLRRLISIYEMMPPCNEPLTDSRAIRRCRTLLEKSLSFHTRRRAAVVLVKNQPSDLIGSTIRLLPRLRYDTAAILMAELDNIQLSADCAAQLRRESKRWQQQRLVRKRMFQKSRSHHRFIAQLDSRYGLPASVRRALYNNPRMMFVPSVSRYDAYKLEDAQEIGFEQTISGPGIVMLILKALDLKQGERVLDIGSGSGWLAALMAEQVGRTGEVMSIERIPELVAMAKINANYLAGHSIRFLEGDGSLGCPSCGLFDCIVATAGAKSVPPPLFGQFRRMLIMPLGGRRRFEYGLTAFGRNSDGSISKERIGQVRFVPMVGVFGQKVQ